MRLQTDFFLGFSPIKRGISNYVCQGPLDSTWQAWMAAVGVRHPLWKASIANLDGDELRSHFALALNLERYR